MPRVSIIKSLVVRTSSKAPRLSYLLVFRQESINRLFIRRTRFSRTLVPIRMWFRPVERVWNSPVGNKTNKGKRLAWPVARSRKMCRSPNRLVLRYVEHRVTGFSFLVGAPSKSSESSTLNYIPTLSSTGTDEQSSCFYKPKFAFSFVASSCTFPPFVSLILTVIRFSLSHSLFNIWPPRRRSLTPCDWISCHPEHLVSETGAVCNGCSVRTQPTCKYTYSYQF